MSLSRKVKEIQPSSSLPAVEIHNHGPKRGVPKKLLAIAGATALSLAVIGGGDIISKIEGSIKKAVPHRQASLDVENVLQSVSLPTGTPFLEGSGTSTAKSDISIQSHGVPVISGLFNDTIGALSHMKCEVTSQDNATLNLNSGALRLSSYKTAAGKLGLRATVNPDDIYLSPPSPQTVLNTGQQYDPACGDPKEIQVASVFGYNSNVAGRFAVTTYLGGLSFTDNCGSELSPDVPAGIAHLVKDEVSIIEPLLSQLPGGAKVAREVSSMTRQPVSVVFQSERATTDGRVRTLDISASSLTIPTLKKPSESGMAHMYRVEPGNLSVNLSSGCWFDGYAVSQQEKLLEQSAQNEIGNLTTN